MNTIQMTGAGSPVCATGAITSTQIRRFRALELPFRIVQAKSLRTFLAVTTLLTCQHVLASPIVAEFVASAPEFEVATDSYTRLWTTEGPRIIEALQRYSGVSLPDQRIRVIVFEGVSRSGQRHEPLWIRASYPEDTKRATLVHELLHRYLDEVDGLETCYPEIHDIMSIMLFDIWSELYGTPFATRQAEVESNRSARYRKSWSHALSLSQVERRSEITMARECGKRLSRVQP